MNTKFSLWRCVIAAVLAMACFFSLLAYQATDIWAKEPRLKSSTIRRSIGLQNYSMYNNAWQRDDGTWYGYASMDDYLTSGRAGITDTTLTDRQYYGERLFGAPQVRVSRQWDGVYERGILAKNTSTEIRVSINMSYWWLNADSPSYDKSATVARSYSTKRTLVKTGPYAGKYKVDQLYLKLKYWNKNTGKWTVESIPIVVSKDGQVRVSFTQNVDTKSESPKSKYTKNYRFDNYWNANANVLSLAKHFANMETAKKKIASYVNANGVAEAVPDTCLKMRFVLLRRYEDAKGRDANGTVPAGTKTITKDGHTWLDFETPEMHITVHGLYYEDFDLYL